MRVAIVGGNLLGCASAVYIRRALDENDASTNSADEIDIFETLPQTGGNKFVTLALSDKKTCAGTARHVDFASSPLLHALFTDANIPLPKVSPMMSWGLFNWEENSYLLWQSPSRFLQRLINNNPLLRILRILLLCFTFHIINKYRRRGLFSILLRRDKFYHFYPNYMLLISIFFSLFLGAGFLPLNTVLQVYNRMWTHFTVPLIAAITYGDHTLRVVSTLAEQFQQHLAAIVERDAASSCITLGHLLSACGLGKYSKVSASEFLNSYRLSEQYVSDVACIPLRQLYQDSRSQPDSSVSALVTLASFLTSTPVPSRLRRQACYLDPERTDSFCDELAQSARARVRTKTEVTTISLDRNNKYVLRGSIADGKEEILGEYDAVVLAAVMDPSKFESDVLEESVVNCFALHDHVAKQRKSNAMSGVNAAKYVSLVKGEFKSDYVRRSSSHAMAENTIILKSVNCAEVTVVDDGLYRVVTGEAPTTNSNVRGVLFANVQDVVTTERNIRKYSAKPLRNLNGEEAPTLILGNRFVNAACIDRIGNDPTLDLLSARNTGSLFKDNVAQWHGF